MVKDPSVTIFLWKPKVLLQHCSKDHFLAALFLCMWNPRFFKDALDSQGFYLEPFLTAKTLCKSMQGFYIEHLKGPEEAFREPSDFSYTFRWILKKQTLPWVIFKRQKKKYNFCVKILNFWFFIINTSLCTTFDPKIREFDSTWFLPFAHEIVPRPCD